MGEKEKQRGRFGFYSAFDNRAMSDDSSDCENEASSGRLVKRRVTIGGAVDSSDDEPLVEGGQRRSSRRYGAYAVPGIAVDLRKASEGGLPDGLEVVGGEGTFEEQEDGSSALLVPEGAHIKITLPGMSPWQLEEDGRLHTYSLLFAMRVDRLP